ncbi:MAG: methionine--tRNA ligase [bacterium]
MSKKFYVTTAIVYANATPHIGYAYEVIAADVIARYKRLCGFDTFFLTGTDEHSCNVHDKAVAMGMDTQLYCDQMAKVYRDVWKKFNISHDDFIRTSEERHVEVVRALLNIMYKNGDIYKGFYEGWYCTSCEAFYLESDLEEGKCPVHKINPKWLKEENYFFKLSGYQDKLLHWIEHNPEVVAPEIRRNEVLNIIKSGLRDISISRSTLKWGIPCPFDESQVVYVWVDALINYVSGVGYLRDKDKFNRFWPADVHIIGKDITRFHCIIWPAMLMAAGLAVPKKVFGHGFLKIKGEKISKTKGNLVDPVALADTFGVDAVRYFLLRHIPFDADGDFSEEALAHRYNGDLANDLGNLLNRTLSMTEQYFQGTVPRPSEEQEIDRRLKEQVEITRRKVDEYINALSFSQALESIWELVNKANKYIDETAPWKLFKADKVRLNTVIHNLVEILRIITIFILPFMPEKAGRMWEQLGVKGQLGGQSIEETRWQGLPEGTKVRKGEILFPKQSA